MSLPEPLAPLATPLVGTPGSPHATIPNWGQGWAAPTRDILGGGMEQELAGDSRCSGSS